MSTHKTIAKNSLFLYFRMFLTMGVGLYTSRLVLEALGVVDYGIYGLVGGIVTMFAFLNGSMAAATQRYLSYDLGKGNIVQLRETFNATLNIHIIIGLIILLLAETIGLWFVNYKLNIPVERMQAANWVYQFSVFAFIMEIIQVPYNALIIAREHMKVYAYMSVFEAVLKLIIVLVLIKVGGDKLIIYSLLVFLVAFVIRLLYMLYCKKYFKESKYHFYYDKSFYKELLSYSGWNLFGNIAAVARGQGNNILLNIFFGPIANAAYSLTNMVQGIIMSFVSNFQVALNPQITKQYARGEVSSSLQLIYKSAKLSFFAMLILIVPFMYNIEFVMHLWLGQIPKFSITFLQLALVFSLIETISNPLMVGAQATGKIKWYQIIIGGFLFLSLPITWLSFKINANPINVYWILIAIALGALIFRIFFLRAIIGLDIQVFLKEVLLPILLVSAIVYSFILLTNYYCSSIIIVNPFLNFLLKAGMISVLNIVLIWVIGLSKSERKFIITFIKNKIPKINK